MRVKLFLGSMIVAISGSLICMEETGACSGVIVPHTGAVGAQPFCRDKMTIEECRDLWYELYNIGRYALKNCEWKRGKRCDKSYY